MKAVVLIMGICILILSGCEKNFELAGNYEDPEHEITLSLMPDHRGEWATLEDNVSFRWERRKNQIWLHTKAGGVLVGNIRAHELVFKVPGSGIYHFQIP